MPDDQKPDPFEDVRKGLGLLFRAARTTLEKLPTKDIEQVVVTTAREVGRAVENVGKTIERDVFGGKGEAKAQPRVATDEAAKSEEPKADEAKPDEPKPPAT
jgi:hypothetical protein